MDIRIHSSSVLLTTNVLYSAIQARFQSNPTVLVRTVGNGEKQSWQREWTEEECYRFAQSVNVSFITLLENGVFPLGSRHLIQHHDACNAQNPPLPLILSLSQLHPSVLPAVSSNT